MGGFLSNLKPENSLEVLNASCGPVRGNIYRHDEKIINGYLGIPYAMALAKELRFTKPVAAEKWKEPRDCYKYGPGCPQSGDKISMLLPPGHREFSEEHCLSLNVFTPSWKSEDFKKGFPVMVYFHGGGFEIGFSSNFDDYSLSGTLPLKEVIVVTVNYRVGPLGFFTTGDDVAVGNYGLWDMTLSLHWVQKHINSFGGDPNCVTVFGSSAGAIGASYLALSPHSNKLFHRYMSMSGAAWWDTAIRPKKLEAEICERFAKHHGYSGNDSESLLSWYKDQPVTKFLETTGVETKASGMGHFTPVFDGDFFPKPFDQLQKMAPKLDVLVTVNEYEGLGFLGLYPNRTSDLVVIASVFGPDVVKNPEEVQKKVLDFYMKDVDQKDAKSVDKRLIEFISDSYFNFPALETVRHATRAGNNGYLASFDYYNMDAKDPYADWFPFRAANHNSELKYMLGEGMGKFEPIEEEFKVMDMVQRLVTNFAKYGNPNGKPSEPQTWQKFSFDKPISYYKIDYPKSEMKDNFQNGRLKIYDEINASGEKYQGMLYSIQTETEEEL